MEHNASSDQVGPVLETGKIASAIVTAIQELNAGTSVQNRGSYLRVMVPARCMVTREAIERALGHDFQFPGDLESVMPSFVGRLQITEDYAVWEFGRTS